MNCRFKVFMVFVFMSFSNGEESLEVCKQKLTEERELHKNDKARLKLHLQKTRHNVRVYQRMVQVMVKTAHPARLNLEILTSYFI